LACWDASCCLSVVGAGTLIFVVHCYKLAISQRCCPHIACSRPKLKASGSTKARKAKHACCQYCNSYTQGESVPSSRSSKPAANPIGSCSITRWKGSHGVVENMCALEVRLGCLRFRRSIGRRLPDLAQRSFSCTPISSKYSELLQGRPSAGFWSVYKAIRAVTIAQRHHKHISILVASK